MKKKALICMASFAIIIGGCANAPAQSEEQAQQEQSAGKVVEVAAAAKPQAPVYLKTTGIAEAKRDVLLAFGSSGKLNQLHVTKGAQVKEGSLLATLETGYYQKAVEAAASQVVQASEQKAKILAGASAESIAETRLQLERARIRLDKAVVDLQQGEKLFAGGALSKNELENLQREKARAELDAQEAQIALDKLLKGAEKDELASATSSIQQAASQVEQAKKSLQDTRLVAPFSGTIVDVLLDEGEMASPGQGAIHLVDLSEMSVMLDVTNDSVDQYKEGAAVQVASPSGHTTKGTVRFVSPVVDQQTGKYKVEISFPNTDSHWRGGMLAEVEIPRSIRGVIVPLESVGISQSERYVMLAADGKAKKQIVTVGQVIGDQIEIVSGLNENDQVITSGITFLMEGEKIVAKGAN